MIIVAYMQSHITYVHIHVTRQKVPYHRGSCILQISNIVQVYILAAGFVTVHTVNGLSWLLYLPLKFFVVLLLNNNRVPWVPTPSCLWFYSWRLTEGFESFLPMQLFAANSCSCFPFPSCFHFQTFSFSPTSRVRSPSLLALSRSFCWGINKHA